MDAILLIDRVEHKRLEQLFVSYQCAQVSMQVAETRQKKKGQGSNLSTRIIAYHQTLVRTSLLSFIAQFIGGKPEP